MGRSWKSAAKEESSNYWPAVADMATATCVILIIFWIAGTWALEREKNRHEKARDQVNSLKLDKTNLEELVEQLREELKELNEMLVSATSEPDRMSALQERIRGLKEQIEILEKAVKEEKNKVAKLEEMLRSAGNAALLEKENTKLEKRLAELLESLRLAKERLAKLEELHKEPPNIVLSDGENYTFPSGKALVTKDFEERFRANELSKIIEALNSPSNVEIVEIVGHTDRNTVPAKSSNLDRRLNAVFEGKASIESLSFGSNTDLGMARAVAVKQLIVECLEEIEQSDANALTEEGRARLKNLVFRTYSAAQLFPVSKIEAEGRAGDSEAGDRLESDRRIEIRFTRFK